MNKIILISHFLFLTSFLYSQGFSSKIFNKRIDKYDLKWNFERKYRTDLTTLDSIEIKPGLYLEMTLSGSELWFKDWNNMNFLVYDLKNKQQSSIGVSGGGPFNENGQIMFYTINESNINLYDFDKRSFKQFDRRTFDLVSNHQIKNFAIYRGAHLEKNQYLLRYDNSLQDRSFSFATYDVEKESFIKEYSIANLLEIEETPDLEMALSGRFVSSQDNEHIIYFCHYGGLFFTFRRNGELLYTSKTLDETPLPKVKKYKFGNNGYAPRPSLGVDFFLDAAVNHKYIMLLNILQQENGHAIDFYNLEDGSYSHSFQIKDYQDQRAILISANNDDLYVMFEENSVKRYAIN